MHRYLIGIALCAALASPARALDCGAAAFAAFAVRAQRGERSAIASGEALRRCASAKQAGLPRRVERAGQLDLARRVERAGQLDLARRVERAGQLDLARRVERAGQWLAFLYAATGDRTRARSIDLPPPPVGSKGWEWTFGRARAGAYGELQRLIDRNAPGYGQHAEAQLVLARAATRKGAFVRGRAAYQAYLRLRPRDEAAACELLYSWIWQGDRLQAQRQLQGQRGDADSADRDNLRGCYWRAAQLLTPQPVALPPAAARSPPAKASTSPPVALLQSPPPKQATGTQSDAATGEPAAWRAAFGVHRTPRLAFRRSLRLERRPADPVAAGSVSDRFGFALAGHTLRLEALGGDTARAAELGVTMRHRLLAASAIQLDAATDLAYWSLGSTHTFGAAELTLGGPGALRAALRGGREPLALQLPLPGGVAGQMRDSGRLLLAYGLYAEWTSELARELGGAPHERHRLLLRLPLRHATDGSQLSLRLPLTTERYPLASPLYLAEPRTDEVGAGIELTQAFARVLLNVTLDYSAAMVTLRDAAASRRRLPSVAAEAGLAVRVARGWRLFTEAAYHRFFDEDADVRRLATGDHVVMGLSILSQSR